MFETEKKLRIALRNRPEQLTPSVRVLELISRIETLEADLDAQTKVAIQESQEATSARVRAQELEVELAEQKDLNRRLVDEQCALTARAEQAERERDEARSEATKLLNDARRLIRERDDARAEAAAAFLAGKAEAREDVERAEAANAALLDILKRWVAADGDSDAPDMGNPKNAAAFAMYMLAADTVNKPHPGAAMLEERQRITRTLDRMDVPSEADEAEMGRTCDLAGRVELLATWGQRGWREYRRLKDAEPAMLERLRRLEADLKEYEDGVQRFNEALGEERRKQDERLRALERAAQLLIRDAERPDSLPETTDEHGERMVRVHWMLVEGLRAADALKG